MRRSHWCLRYIFHESRVTSSRRHRSNRRLMCFGLAPHTEASWASSRVCLVFRVRRFCETKPMSITRFPYTRDTRHDRRRDVHCTHSAELADPLVSRTGHSPVCGTSDDLLVLIADGPAFILHSRSIASFRLALHPESSAAICAQCITHKGRYWDSAQTETHTSRESPPHIGPPLNRACAPSSTDANGLVWFSATGE